MAPATPTLSRLARDATYDALSPSSVASGSRPRSLIHSRDASVASARDEASGGKLPWWQGPEVTQRRSGFGKGKGKAKAEVPYEIKGVRMGQDRPGRDLAYCVEFFPFTGPKRPPVTRAWRSWDCWEDAAAYCAVDKVVVGRCVDEPGRDSWQVFWEFRLQVEGKEGENGETLYHVTWTVNPFNLHPIVTAAGKTGLIYVLDVVDRKLVRALTGHGDLMGEEVHSLAICPTHPHILASGSRDQTIRIWNLYGHEVELPEGYLPNQNYPQADADEGNHIVAVLCGQWPGGNRDDVTALAWHNSHRAIASTGRDQTIKIWIVPPLPPPVVPKPARTYRPELVLWPIFSTNRVTHRPLDSIAWLSEDILITKSSDRVITFQWLSYRRYFDYGRWDPLGDYLHAGDSMNTFDIDDSRSIMIISNLKLPKSEVTYVRFGFHARFRPTTDEAVRLAASPRTVQDFLLAIPQASKVPDILLYAPVHAPGEPVPFLDTTKRFDIADFDALRIDREEDEKAAKQQEEAEREAARKVKKLKQGPAGGSKQKRQAAVEEGAKEGKKRTKGRRSEIRAISVEGAPPSPATLIDEPMTDVRPQRQLQKGKVQRADLSGATSEQTLDAAADVGGTPVDALHSFPTPNTDIAEDQMDRSTSVSGRQDAPNAADADANEDPDTWSDVSSDTSEIDRKALDADLRARPQRHHRWQLSMTGWETRLKKHPMVAAAGFPEGTCVIQCCAISPRGAKWVLGVGDAQTLFVWRLKE